MLCLNCGKPIRWDGSVACHDKDGKEGNAYARNVAGLTGWVHEHEGAGRKPCDGAVAFAHAA